MREKRMGTSASGLAVQDRVLIHGVSELISVGSVVVENWKSAELGF